MKYIYHLMAILAVANTLKAQPTYVWAKKTGAGLQDYGNSIAVDGSGNHYTTGAFSNINVDFDPGTGVAPLSSKGSEDIFIAKYDASGNYLWAKSIGDNLSEVGNEIYLDAAGNIYLTGYFSDTVDFDPGVGVSKVISNGASDVFLAKYDNNGNYQWAIGLGGTQSDAGYSIATDNAGNVYVTGAFAGTNVDFDPGIGSAPLTSISNGEDVFFAKYDAGGNYVWAKSIGSNNIDRGYGLAIDDLGNVYLAGTFYSSNVDFDPGAGVAGLTSNGLEDAFLAKYTTNGTYVWAQNLGGTQSDQAFTIGLDPLANVYVGGFFSSANTDFDPGSGASTLSSLGGGDIFYARYDSSGAYIWARQIGSAGTEHCEDLDVDSLGHVYITGYFNGTNVDFDPGSGSALLSSNASSDICFGHYDNNGDYVWAAKIGGTGNDHGNGIAAGVSGFVSINGFFAGSNIDFNPGTGINNLSASGFDIFFGKYHNCGLAPAQPAIIFGPGSICENSVNTHSVTPVGDALFYTWTLPSGFSGSSTGPGIIDTAGNTSGTLSVTANNPCGASLTQTLSVIVNPLPIILIAGNPTTCEGNNYCMVASGASTYNWSGPCAFSSTNDTVCINSTIACGSGPFSVTGTDINSCVNSATFSVTVNPLPGVNYMQSPMYACINWAPFSLSTGTPSGGTYTGTGVSGNQFDPANSGAGLFTITYNYTDTNGCSNSDTSSVNVDLCMGLTPLIRDPLLLYPIPVAGTLFIRNLMQHEKVEIAFYDLCGKLISKSSVTAMGSEALEINTDQLKNGTYFYHIKSGESCQSGKISVVKE